MFSVLRLRGGHVELWLHHGRDRVPDPGALPRVAGHGQGHRYGRVGKSVGELVGGWVFDLVYR